MAQSIRLALTLLLALAVAPNLFAGGEGWLTDYAAAKKKAAKEKKDLILDFTGSDWCGWCIRLNNEVFSKEDFKKQAPKHFVLVELDFPRGKQQSAAIKAQNRKLQQEFGVQGYPTIFLVDSQGRPYARTGYRPGGAQKYLEHLTDLRGKRAERDKLFEAAKKKKGAERAKMLDQALTGLEGVDVFQAYKATVEEIIKHDASNKYGLKAKYEVQKSLTKGDFDGALKTIDSALKESKASGEVKQQLHFFRAVALFQKSRDLKATIEALENALKAAPKTEKAKEISGIIENLKKQL